MPRTLHLIKHGQPALDHALPAHEWELAPDALHHLPVLATHLDPLPQIVVSSEEPEAKATAQALANLLDLPYRTMLGLHEQLRYTNQLWPHAEFQERYRQFFAEPAQVVVGEESADAAHARFSNAVAAVMAVNTQEMVAVVAHGTVISLLVGRATGRDPYVLWQELELLQAVTLKWPTPDS